jgi:hypothetical protein
MEHLELASSQVAIARSTEEHRALAQKFKKSE